MDAYEDFLVWESRANSSRLRRQGCEGSRFGRSAFVGMLMDLPGVNFALKMIQLFDRQAVEKLNAALDLKGRLQKMLALLLLRTLERHGIIDAPVGADRGARKSRARSRASSERVMTKSKSWSAKSCQEFADRAGGIYFEVFAENFQDEGMNFASRSFTGAANFKAVAAHRSEQDTRRGCCARSCECLERGHEIWDA